MSIKTKLTFAHAIECVDCGTGYSVGGPLGAYFADHADSEGTVILCDECAQKREDAVFELSGVEDEDMFLTEDDMSDEHWEALMACHHQGECDADCKAASEIFAIKDLEAAHDMIISAGVEKERFELANGERDFKAVTEYYLWMIAGAIQSEMAEKEDEQ